MRENLTHGSMRGGWKPGMVVGTAAWPERDQEIPPGTWSHGACLLLYKVVCPDPDPGRVEDWRGGPQDLPLSVSGIPPAWPGRGNPRPSFPAPAASTISSIPFTQGVTRHGDMGCQLRRPDRAKLNHEVSEVSVLPAEPDCERNVPIPA